MSYFFIKRLWFFKLAVLVLFFSSCKKEAEEPQENIPIFQNRVFVINEGAFQNGNASLSVYDKKNKGLYIDVYKEKNGTGLGDIFQSMLIKDNKIFLAINNSNKILVADLSDYHNIGEISSVSSPRYILPVTTTKAYVSSLWDHNLAIIDMNELKITGYIPMPGWTEEMAMVNNTAFVTSVRSSAVYLVNTSTDMVIDSIVVGVSPKNILKDKNNKLWVLCGEYDSPYAQLVRINPQNKSIEFSLDIAINQYNAPDNLKINGTRDTLYFIENGSVVYMSIADSVPHLFLSSSHFITPYGLDIDPSNSEVYVADAMDFSQKGYLLRFSPMGEIIDSMKIGYVPSGFYFE